MSVPNAEDPYEKLEESIQILELFGLDQRVIEMLEKRGHLYIKDLQKVDKKDLLQIHHVGEKIVWKIAKALREFLEK